MRRSIILVSAIALLAACERKTDTATTPPAAAAVDQAPSPKEGNALVPAFVSAVGSADLYEIQAGQIALKRSKTKAVQVFAQMMIDAHTRSTMDLMAAVTVTGLSIPAPTTLTPELQMKIDALNAADAGGFDKLYVAEQVEAHEAALLAVQGYVAGPDAGAVHSFAVTLAPIVADHLAKARALQPRP